MFPGGPRNERQMQMMMRRLGMTTEPVDNVDEVIIRTRDKEHIFDKPEVTILTVQGVRTYQVVGVPQVHPRTAGATGPATPPSAPATPVGPSDEDVELVVSQANVTREEAIEALLQTNGEPAEAILRLLSRREPGRG